MGSRTDQIKELVRERYGAVATQRTGCCGPDEPIRLVDAGTAAEQVVGGADLGLGCGIPTRFAELVAGETVLDLGSGAGIDVFRAANAVGPTGRVIGVDMTPEMIARAWDNATRGGYVNVDFRLGDIEELPVAHDSVDVVLSNCVINLIPDKRRVFAEIHRVLRPAGGRFVISDIVSRGAVPDEIRSDMELWAGCVAGALDRDEYLGIIRDTGFQDVEVTEAVRYDDVGTADYGIESITVRGRKA